jgi:hypothetical protein
MLVTDLFDVDYSKIPDRPASKGRFENTADLDLGVFNERSPSDKVVFNRFWPM